MLLSVGKKRSEASTTEHTVQPERLSCGKEQAAARHELPAGAQAAGLWSARRHGESRQAQLREVARRAVVAAGNNGGRGGNDVRVAVRHTQQSALRAIATQAVLVATSGSTPGNGC